MARNLITALIFLAVSLSWNFQLRAAGENTLDDIREKIHSLNELAGMEAKNENFMTSMQLSQTALDLSQKYGILDEAAAANENLADNYLGFKNQAEAVRFYQEAVRLNEKLNNNDAALRLHKKISALLLQNGNYQRSIEHLNAYQNLKDSIDKQKQKEQIAGMEAQFAKEISDTENRLTAVQDQKQKTNEILLITAVALLVLVVIALIIAVQKHLQVKKYFLRLNEQKDRMFSLISHGLRGPIGSVKGIFDLIVEQDMDDPKELKSILNESREVVDSSFNLLENLLNWSKSQTGNLTVNPQKISVGSLVKENLMLFTSSIKHKNFTIENHVSDEHYAYADMEMINIVIRNILSNSVKFTRTAGKISLYSQIAKDRLLLTVSDTGVGMTRDMIDEIMEDDPVAIGYNEANYEKDRGIGLKICKDFLQKNNGKLSIESSPNQGSRFFIYLPLSA
ncbi:sensor histidine kinase [Mangrovibacterium diazotrophicum]|uniref:histidine kinase n=1 Tax=Mangrovibacterium diazotrophicum TaxID=1261403 RepID=A0A419VXH1_9BACT|nr:HAMP domain-containing sensor histidine kinase [Mangrovibacterium diazotrophicum]RKD87922.1 histidine kinase/DNA gyrase B/HSP90-like ATPase [Mangrovibacterium diazotrophicum]